MRSFLIRTLFLWSGLALAGASSAADHVQVYFSAREQSAPEHATNQSFSVHLSRASSLEVVVPFYVDPELTTASPTSGGAQSDGDYYITQSPEDGFVWNYEEARGTITFRPGARSYTVPVRVVNDALVEGDERIVFRLDTDNITVARPVEPSTLTFNIIDTDPVAVHLNGLEFSALEGSPIPVDLITSSPSARAIHVRFEVSEGSGFDRSNESWPLNDTFIIPAGSDRRTFNLPTLYDPNSTGETKHFDLRLLSAREADHDNELPIDARTARLAILDSGPLEVGINVGSSTGAAREGRTIQEYGNHSVTVSVSAAQSQDVIIPITLGGSAIRGDQSANANTFEYTSNLSEENTLTLPKNTRSVSLQLTIGARGRPTPGATIDVNLGTPRLADGTNLPLGEVSSYRLTIVNNPPTTLSFGYENPDYDEIDIEENPAFIPSGGFVVARSSGFVQIPVFLSNPHGTRTDFRLTVLSEGTNARLQTGNVEDWDFYVSNPQGGRLNVGFDQELSGNIQPGSRGTSFQLILNPQRGNRATYPWSRDPESDRQIRMRLSEVNTSESGVSLGQHSEFTLTVRSYPDIDVTHLFLDPVPSSVPAPHSQTGLHELSFDFNLAGAAPDATGLEGYRAYKVVFQPGTFDPANRDAPSNDPLWRTNRDSSGLTFDLDVTAPFRPRYPSQIQHEVLIEGEPRTGATFRDEHANVRMVEYLFFHPLDIAPLDPVRGEIAHPDGASLEDDFSFLIEFTNNGERTFDLSRLSREGAVRIYLTRDLPPNPAPTSVIPTNNLLRFLPQADGSVLIEVHNSQGAPLNVQYLDDDGQWRNAQAPVLRNLGNRLLWIDHGPPRTHRHPSEVPFRLYRFSTTN